MIIVPEREIAGLITAADCFTAVEQVFASMARKSAYNFPVIREAIGHADALYGFKSGFDRESLALGLKSGGFWPRNGEQGLTNHQSAIFLFDADSGQCRAVVGGNLLTALRTAAASAISIKHLARPDAKVLGMIGAGHQSTFQLRAALDQRAFDKVVGWNIDPGGLIRLEAVAAVRRDLELTILLLDPLLDLGLLQTEPLEGCQEGLGLAAVVAAGLGEVRDTYVELQIIGSRDGGVLHYFFFLFRPNYFKCGNITRRSLFSFFLRY